MKKVTARVGKFEFVGMGKLQTATNDAAVGLLNKLQDLEWEELDLVRTESSLPDGAGKLLFRFSFFQFLGYMKLRALAAS